MEQVCSSLGWSKSTFSELQLSSDFVWSACPDADTKAAVPRLFGPPQSGSSPLSEVSWLHGDQGKSILGRKS